MPAEALALVLVAAFLHALWNLAAKRAGGGAHFALLCVLFTCLLWAPLGVAIGWRVVPGWGAAEWGVVASSAVVHVAYFLTLLRGYRLADLTVVYPVARGTGPLLSALGAVVLLGETLSGLGLAGVMAITLGVFLIAGGPSLWRLARGGAATPADADGRLRSGLAYGALTGCLIACYTVIDGYAVKLLLLSPILFDYAGHWLRLLLMLPIVLHDRRGFLPTCRRQWRPALVVAVFSPLAYVLVLYAVRIAPLSHVAPAREVSMLFAALIGGRLLGEADRGPRLAGAACIALGVGALAWG